MRRFLDGLYLTSGVVAALCMIGVLVAITTSIVVRQIGVHIGGLNAYAGYWMAAAGFLALAHTLTRGEHIRVSLLLSALPKKGRRRLDIFAMVVGCFIAANLCWFSFRLVYDSYIFNDVSTSDDATPLWIPQISMAVGTLIFFIAFIDITIQRIRGKDVLSSHDELELQQYE